MAVRCGLPEGDFTEESGLMKAGLGGVDGAPRDEVGHGEVVATLVDVGAQRGACFEADGVVGKSAAGISLIYRQLLL